MEGVRKLQLPRERPVWRCSGCQRWQSLNVIPGGRRPKTSWPTPPWLDSPAWEVLISPQQFIFRAFVPSTLLMPVLTTTSRCVTPTWVFPSHLRGGRRRWAWQSGRWEMRQLHWALFLKLVKQRTRKTKDKMGRWKVHVKVSGCWPISFRGSRKSVKC